MAGIAAPNIVKDGLVFYVDAMNPRSWTGPDSSTVNNLRGTNTGSIAADTSGSFGENNSFTFDGVDDRIDTGFVPKDNITSNFTISVWANLNSVSNTAVSALFGTSYFASPYSFFDFGINRVSLTYYYYYWLGGGSNRPTSTTDYTISNFSLNTWQQFIVTYDGSDLKLYNDNSLEHTISSVTITDLPPHDTGFSGTSYMGATHDSRPASNPKQLINGEIGPTQIYNKALTQAEVTQNYNALKGRFGL